MENLPIYISIVFILTTIFTVWLFYKAAGNSKITLILLLVWLSVQAIIGLTSFYTVTNTTPPRFMLLTTIPILTIITLIITPGGRKYIDRLDIKVLTLLHIIRIPVELVLFWLFIYKKVPAIMTFEGRNFDIISGLTAPFIVYFGFMKQKLRRNLLLFWNFICLGLLINIVINAILSAPFPFQKFAFDQPDVAILYFPFIWLPCCVVPLVLLSHLAAIKQLIVSGRKV